MKKMMAVLAATLMPVACGTLSPTSSDAPAAAGGSQGTVTSAALGRPTGTQCAATGLKLNNVKGAKLTIAAQFVDGLGNPVPSLGCPDVVWTISPEGAYVRPLAADRNGAIQAQVLIYGIAQTYTVTATASRMSGSIDIIPAPPNVRR